MVIAIFGSDPLQRSRLAKLVQYQLACLRAPSGVLGLTATEWERGFISYHADRLSDSCIRRLDSLPATIAAKLLGVSERQIAEMYMHHTLLPEQWSHWAKSYELDEEGRDGISWTVPTMRCFLEGLTESLREVVGGRGFIQPALRTPHKHVIVYDVRRAWEALALKQEGAIFIQAEADPRHLVDPLEMRLGTFPGDIVVPYSDNPEELVKSLRISIHFKPIPYDRERAREPKQTIPAELYPADDAGSGM